MKRFILTFLVAGISLCHAQTPHQAYLTDKTAYREHPLDITRMKLEVRFEPVNGKVIGKVHHLFTVIQQQVDSVFFDAPGIAIQQATLNGAPVSFSINKTGVWVKPAKPLHWDEQGDIGFDYVATPKRGIYFIGWKDTVNLDPANPFGIRKQIWTQGQGIDNRHWIPMYDDMNDKFITETTITFDNQYQVLSNGNLVDKKNSGNSTTWHYSMTKPHAGYLLMIAVGKYAVLSGKTKRGVPLYGWYYPEFKDRAEPTYRYTADMMDFLEKETGINYPWESYSQVMVQDFIYGAMENTTATIFGDFFNVDERAFPDRKYVGVNCHEMTHQWFGDYITARDARDSWLQESFATYWPKQFSKVNEGIEEWDWQRRGHQNTAIEAGKKDNYPVRHTMGGTARNYPKGAAVISMLEYVLGEAQWQRALTHYLKTHAYGNVETNDLKQAIQDKLGLDMSWFFDEWILRGGEPHYRVHYEDLTASNGSRTTEIAIEQIHKTDETVKYFTMPVWLEVHYTDGTTDRINERIDEAFEVVKIPNTGNRKIDFVLFDPGSNVMKQLTFKKGYNELNAQAEKASAYLDRFDAIAAMKELPIAQKRGTLMAALLREKHYGIRNEIISQLAGDDDGTVNTALITLLTDRATRSSTKEAVIRSLRTLTPQWKEALITSLSDSSYEVIRSAMDKLVALSFDAQTIRLMSEKTRGVYGMNNSVVIRQLEYRILASRSFSMFSGDENAASPALIRYASPVYEFRTRILAFGSLKNLNLCTEDVVRNLFQAMLSSNGRLAGPAAQTADYFSTQVQYKQMMITYFNRQNYTNEEKETLKKQLNFL